MTLETAYRTLLDGTTALTDLVGTKIWHAAAQEDLGEDATAYYPCVIFRIPSRTNIEAMGSSAHAQATLRVTSLSAVSPDEAVSVAAQVYAVTHRFTPGLMGGAGGVTVLASLLDSEEREDDIDSGVFTVAQNYTVHYEL